MKALRRLLSRKGRKITLRSPTMRDVPELVRYWNAISREDTFINKSGERFTAKRETETMQKKLKEQRGGIRFSVIALHGKRIVGHTSLTRGRFKRRNRHVGEFGIGVLDGFRGEGIGKALIRELEKKASQWTLRIFSIGVFACNAPAIRLYRALGFAQCGRIPEALYRKGKYCDELLMFKRLGGRSK